MEERLPDREDAINFDRDAFIHFDLDLANSEWIFSQDQVRIQNGLLMCEYVVLVGDFNVPTRESHSITPNIKVRDINETYREMEMKELSSC